MSIEPRYVNQDLFLPKSFHTEFKERLVDQSKEHAPFLREVDLWWYALGIGVSNNDKAPLPNRDRLVKFNNGGILETNPWRITHLELLALAEEGEGVAGNPRRVVQIANEYAVAGCASLVELLRDSIDNQSLLLSHASQRRTAPAATALPATPV